jgi:hypothetical protein
LGDRRRGERDGAHWPQQVPDAASVPVEPAKVMGVLNQIGTIQPGMIADMDIIHGNPLQDIETIANDVYVMQNGRLLSQKQLLGPYANVQLNTAPLSSSKLSVALAEEETL